MAIPFRIASRTILGASGVAVPHTGNTDETLLASVAVPPMGPNDRIQVFALYSYTNSVNTKTPRIRHHSAAGTSGAVFGTNTLTTTAQCGVMTEIANRGATNSQVGGVSNGSLGGSGSSVVTGSLQTNAGSFINITGQLANGTETITLEQYRVELITVGG